MEKIGRYRVIGELGRGAMGVVYRAEDPAIGRTVAIKTIKLGDLTDTTEREFMRERLRREARSAGILSHPGIVTIYDIFEEGDTAFVLMEFVNGETLEAKIKEAGRLDKDRIFDVLRQTAAALDYAHEKGIVHRDIKPANVMISVDGQAKITDFGVAKILSQQMTQTRSVLGTPYYMSPEQIQGGQIGGASDQFALAVIAFELMTGDRPYAAESLPTLLYKIVQEEAPPPHRLNPSLASDVGKVFERAFQKEPGDRFGNCTELVSVLAMAASKNPGWEPLTREAAGDMETARSSPRQAGFSEETEVVGAVDGSLESGPFEKTKVPPKPVLPPMPKTRMREEFPEEERSSAGRYMLLVVMLALIAGGIYAYFEYFSPGAPVMEQVAEETTADQPPDEAAAAQASGAFPAPPPPVAAGDGSDSGSSQMAQPAVPPPPLPTSQAKPESVQQAPADPVPEPPKEAAPPKPEPVKSAPAKPKQYWVQIRSNPAGATVKVDDDPELTCRTPCEAPLKPGRHVLNFSLAGHRLSPRIIQVPQVTAVTMNLIRESGTLAIRSNPAGASIFINGERRREKTPAMIKLPVGDYRIKLTLQGRPDYDDSVTVRDQVITTFGVDW